tara:strand:+ start:482 stop:799 length:318 start_codon:yes stop_codon:yes gene_type:complete
MSQDNSKKESSELEPNAQMGAMGKTQGEEGNTSGNSPKYRVRIRSYRVRQLDLDNLYGGVKYFVDTLRYAEIIPDDDPESISLEVSQEKVKSYKNEKTELEVKCV